MKKKVFATILCATLAFSLFAGCSSSSDSTSEASSVSEASSESEAEVDTSSEESTASEETASGDVCTVYYIPNNMGNPYFESIEDGFLEAMEELGEDNFNFVFTGPAEATATSQIEYVEAAVQNGADIIFIAANSNDALNATFEEAREAGTMIYIINQDIPGSEDYRDCAIMPCDFSVVGVLQMELMAELMDYEGQFAILSSTTDAPDQNTWIEGIQEELESNDAYSDMELVAVVYGDDQPDKSTTEMESLLATYPDLKGVIAPTTVGIAAAAKVIQTQGVGDQVKLTGLGLPSEMEEFILDGTVEAFQLWNPPYEGYLAAYVAYATVFEGWTPTAGATIECGKLGEYTVTDDLQIITLAEPMTYDIDNIEEYAAQF